MISETSTAFALCGDELEDAANASNCTRAIIRGSFCMCGGIRRTNDENAELRRTAVAAGIDELDEMAAFRDGGEDTGASTCSSGISMPEVQPLSSAAPC